MLFDCALIQLGEEQFVWYWNQHHAVTDARSTQLTFDMLNELYVKGELEAKSRPGSLTKFLTKWSSSGLGGERGSATSVPSVVPLQKIYGQTPRSGETRSVRHVLKLNREQAARISAWSQRGHFINPAVAAQNFFLTLVFAYSEGFQSRSN